METDPKKMRFWTQQPVPVEGKIETCRFEDMAVACHELGVDDSGSEPLRIVYPLHDLGGERTRFDGRPVLVYATIDHSGNQMGRTIPFADAFGHVGKPFPDSARPYPLE